MFSGCSSLININLPNFNFKSSTKIKGMFARCNSLNKNNIIIKDRTILNNEELF